MNTLITYPSSYSFWMNHNPPMRRKELDIKQDVVLSVDASSDYYADLASNLHLFAPIHLMTSKSNERKKRKTVRCHVMSKNLRTASAVQVSPFVWVTSPELTYLLAASDLSFPKLVMVAINLCGTFYYENGIQKYRKPIVTVQQLNRFLETVSNVKGLRNAKAALRYVSEGSNSPIETRMAAISMLPLNRGGCTLLPAKRNNFVQLSDEGRAILHRNSLCCDMVWPEQKVIVEYDSKEYHMNEDQFTYDKNRISALNLSGYRVISATNAILKSPESIESFFSLVQKSLGMTIRPERFAKYKDLRRKTIKEIFYDREVWQLWIPPDIE